VAVSAIRSRRDEAASVSGVLVDANATARNKIEGAFNQIVSGIAFVIVHHATHVGHAIVIERSTRSAKLLVDFHVHFSFLVVARRANDLESFVKAVGKEDGTVNILLEIGRDRCSGLRSDNHAISKTAAAKQVEFLVVVVEGNGSSGSRLERVERGSATNSESSAALGDDGTGGAGDGANAHNHVLALYQFSGMVEHGENPQR